MSNIGDQLHCDKLFIIQIYIGIQCTLDQFQFVIYFHNNLQLRQALIIAVRKHCKTLGVKIQHIAKYRLRILRRQNTGLK